MRCMIVEDEEPAIKVLENHIGHFNDLEISSVHTNAMDALSALRQTKVDILFLDIQLPKISGIDFLKSLTHRPAVILTTAHKEYALEGYDLEVVDYLLKPISFERFARALSKVYQRFQKNLEIPQAELEKISAFSAPFLYIKCDREYIKVLLEELLYVESVKNHIKIVTDQGTLLTLMSMSQIEEKLPAQHFVRVHRSFMVSIHKVSKFNHAYVSVGKKSIPIGRHYKQAFFDRIDEKRM